MHRVWLWGGGVQRFPWHKHITSGVDGVGVVTFLLNNYRVPHVVVREVKMDVGAHLHLPPAALQWTPHQPGRTMEGDHIYPGIWGMGVAS